MVQPHTQPQKDRPLVKLQAMKIIFKPPHFPISFQFFIFLAFSLLYAAYTANIVSLLQSPSKSIKTLSDLYESKILLWAEDTPYLRYYFPKAEKPIQRKIYLEKLASPGKKDHYVSAQEGVAKIRKGLNGNDETGENRKFHLKIFFLKLL